jgi:hypothetical protein
MKQPGRCRPAFPSIIEPEGKCLVLLVRVWRKQVIDGDVWGRDQH